MEGQSDGSLVLTTNVSAQPKRIVDHTEGHWIADPYHATIPGKEAYDPVTHKKVPKYFAPMDASAMLIPKPTAQERRPARMNGQRNLNLSEK